MPDQDIYLPDLAQDRDRLARLLRSLLATPEDADDAAQEAYLRALRSDRPRRIGSMFGWLAATAKHALFDEGRAARRRVRREGEHAAAESLPSTMELAAEAEIRARVQAAIQSLEEPYRDVLLDRYYGDLSVADIARRDGLSKNTVKSRLVRARAVLLRRLESEGLGREVHWSVAAASLLSLPGAQPGVAGAASEAASLGVHGGSMKWTMGVLLMVLVVSGTSWLVVTRGHSSELTRTVTAVDPRTVGDPSSPERDNESDALAMVASPSSSVRVAADVPPIPPIHRKSERWSFASETVAVTATISTAAGAPIRGAEFLITQLASGPRAVSDESGEVSLTVRVADLAALRPQAIIVRVRARGFASARRSIGERTVDGYFVGHIKLDPGGIVTGQILDPSGEPLAGASVSSFRPISADGTAPYRHELTRPKRRTSEVVTTDAAGRYRIKGVPLGSVAVCAHAKGTFYAITAAHRVEPGARLVIPPIQLRSAPRSSWISGRVLTADGTARRSEVVFLISADGSGRLGTTETDGLGAFWFVTSPGGSRVVRAGLVGHDPLYAYGVEPGRTDVLLRPKELRTFTVRAKTSAGDPVKSFFVSCELLSGMNIHRCDGTSDDGRPLELPMPPAAFRVDVYSPPLPTVWHLGPFDADAIDLVVEAVFQPFKGFTGAVRVDGKLAGGVLIEAYGIRQQERAHLQDNGLYVYESRTRLSFGTSLETGAFQIPFYVEQAFTNGFRELELRATVSGQFPQRLLRIDLARIVQRKPVEFESVELAVATPGQLEGRVIVREGQDLRGWVVAISNGDGHTYHRVISSASTAFQFDGLAPGGWQVVAGPRTRTLSTAGGGQGPPVPIESIPWSVVVSSGETARFDIEVGEAPVK